MSEQNGTETTTKQRRSRKTSTTNQQNGKQTPAVQCPTNDDKKAWKAYWKAQGQSWRTEPEIDEDRQRFLTERRSIAPDIEQGIYPFKDIKLSRADVEWLLATLENGKGPIKYDEEQRHEREGLDLSGAILCDVNLSRLPLTKLRAGLSLKRWKAATEDQRKASAIHLEKANLFETYLEGAQLRGAHLEGAYIKQARLQYAYFTQACLAGASLQGAHLEGTKLSKTYLARKVMPEKELEQVRIWVKDFPEVLPPTDLRYAYFNAASEPIDTILGDTKHYGVSLVDVRWGGVNLALINWSLVKVLGDEHEARQMKVPKGDIEAEAARVRGYQIAVRANRQLAVVLRDQGLNEEADYFAYRAQVLQRVVWRLQKRPLKFVLSWFLYLIAGYGYRPVRSLAWYLIIIFGFALAYFAFGHIPPLEAFVFSLTSFHGRGFFPGSNISLSDPRVVVAAFEAVVGLLIEISFIATFTQRFFGK